MNFSLTISDCTSAEVQLLMTVSEIISGDADYITDDYRSLGYLMDKLIDYYGSDIESFVAYLWCDPEDFMHVANKMEEFAKLVREAAALSKDERAEIRVRIRARDRAE